MTLTIELTPEEAAKLHDLAQARGIDDAGALRELLAAVPPKPRTGAEAVAMLEREGVFGVWVDREDIKDSADFARQLRRQAETRNRD